MMMRVRVVYIILLFLSKILHILLLYREPMTVFNIFQHLLDYFKKTRGPS